MDNILGLDNDLQDTADANSSIAYQQDTPNEVASAEAAPSVIPTYASQPQVIGNSHKPAPDPLISAANGATQTYFQNEFTDRHKGSAFNNETKERYKSDPSIYNDHFDPKADNEKVAYENWDKWDAISAGLSGFKDNFINSYKESAYTWTRAAKALFNLDTDYLTPDQNEYDKLAYEQHQRELSNPIFYAPGTENDFLTKGFLSESINNLGFTFGTIGEIITEQLLTKGLEVGLAATGIGVPATVALEGATDTAAIGKLGKLWKNLGTLFTGTALGSTELLAQEGKFTGLALSTNVAGDVVEAAQSFNQAQNVVANGVKYGSKFWDNALSLATNVPFAGELATAAQISRAGKGVLTSGELFKVGAGGLRRAFGEWQMAAGEASIESAGIYKDQVDKLKDDYTKKNGTEPLGQDLEDIKKNAMQVATVDFGTNVAILGIMNKISWGNIPGNFGFDSKALNKVKNKLAADAAELGIVTAGTGKATKFYQKDFLGTIGLLPKIASNFTKKEAAWELGKSMIKGLTRIEIAEGIQENLQDITSIGLKDYYADLYNSDIASWGDSFNEAVNSQFTKQGAKTFLMGALTGIMAHPGMHTIQYGMQSKFLNPDAAAHRQAVKNSIDTLNNFYKGDSENILKETIKQIKLQTMYNNGMTEGILTKDKYQYFNNKDSALIQIVMHAKRTGTLSNLTSFIKGYSDSFSNEEFKAAFGFSPEEVGKGTTQEVMGGIADSVKNYSDIFDNYQDKFGILMSVEDLINDPNAKQKFSVKRAALMDAISTVAFIESKSKQSIKRSAEIVQRISSYESIGNSLNTAFGSLTSPEKMDDSIFILENEIKSLNDSITPEVPMTPQTKKMIESKQKELDLLEQVKMVMFRKERIPDPTDSTKTIEVYDTRTLNSIEGILPFTASVMTQYLQHKNDQAGIKTKVSLDEVNNAMKDIYDYMSLGQDHAEYSDAVNFLNDPETFSKYTERLMDARASAHARLLYDSYMELGKISEAAQKWLDDNKALTDEILNFSKKSSGTFQNMIKLQNLANELAKKFDEFGLQAVEEKQKEIETIIAQAKKVVSTRTPKPAEELFEEGQEDSDKMAEYDEYMTMRFNLSQIEKEFPYQETDLSKRTITRYYTDENGEKIAFPNPMIVPVSYEFGLDKEGNPVIVNLNTYENVLMYMRLFEQSVYNKYTSQQTISTTETDTKTEAIDNEKVKLSNHIDGVVMVNGNKGILSIENNKYIVTFSDGTTAEIAEVVEGEELTFDDFEEFSPAYESLASEDKEVMSPTANPIVDSSFNGAVTIELDDSLETATINGVVWTIVKNDDGLAIEFTRISKKKKGKGFKIIQERLSGKNPKGADYVARINTILVLSTRELPAEIDLLADRSEALDEIISETEQAIETESSRRKKSDEIFAQYRLNIIKNQLTSPEILELKAKFANPLERKNLTEEDLIKLFSWADDLIKKINKDLRLFLTNEIISSEKTALIKEFINPIKERIDKQDGRTKPGSKTTSKRRTSKRGQAQELIESVKSSKSKRAASKSEGKAEPKAATKKKGVAKSVKEIEQKADKKIAKKTKVSTTQVITEKTQSLPIKQGEKSVKTVNAKKVSDFINNINGLTELPLDVDPFNAINSKITCSI